MQLHDGRRLFGKRTDDGFWRAELDNVHFCAPNKARLRELVAARFALAGEHSPQPFVAAEPQDSLPLLQRRNQEARAEGREPQRFPASNDALALAQRLGKSFEDVTQEELTQHVHDLVLRSRLLLELGARLRA